MSQTSFPDERVLERLELLASQQFVQDIHHALGPESELHLVGGIVRDTLIGKPNEDIDLACKLSPTEARERLEECNFRVIVAGRLFQTMHVVPLNGPTVELSSFRGAHTSPTSGYVAGTSIEEDLVHRDFTINALAFSIKSQQLIDVTGGVADLANGLVRAVGHPEQRFREDPLRLLRFVRFCSRDSFAGDAHTSTTAKNLPHLLSQVSVERIRDEFSEILLADHADRGLRLLVDYGLLPFVLPELSITVDFEQNKFHYRDVFEHTLEVVSKTKPDLLLRLAALLHDIGKPSSLSVDSAGERHFYKHEIIGADIAESALFRLRYPKELVADVVSLVKTHMRPTSAGAPGIRRLLRDTGDLYQCWRDLKEADVTSVRLDQENLQVELQIFDQAVEEIRQGADVSPLKNLAIRGADLLELGFKPGPRIGELLRQVHEMVLDDPELNTRETLLGIVKGLGTPENGEDTPECP